MPLLWIDRPVVKHDDVRVDPETSTSSDLIPIWRMLARLAALHHSTERYHYNERLMNNSRCNKTTPIPAIGVSLTPCSYTHQSYGTFRRTYSLGCRSKNPLYPRHATMIYERPRIHPLHLRRWSSITNEACAYKATSAP